MTLAFAWATSKAVLALIRIIYLGYPESLTLIGFPEMVLREKLVLITNKYLFHSFTFLFSGIAFYNNIEMYVKSIGNPKNTRIPEQVSNKTKTWSTYSER